MVFSGAYLTRGATNGFTGQHFLVGYTLKILHVVKLRFRRLLDVHWACVKALIHVRYVWIAAERGSMVIPCWRLCLTDVGQWRQLWMAVKLAGSLHTIHSFLTLSSQCLFVLHITSSEKH
jgi:hypothetical protein